MIALLAALACGTPEETGPGVDTEGDDTDTQSDTDTQPDTDTRPEGFTHDGVLTDELLVSSAVEQVGFGYSVAVGDVSGDGRDDLVVSATQASVMGVNNGAVYVFFGPVATEVPFTEADATLVGADGDYAGTDLALADLDGDGTDELLVSAYGGPGGGSSEGRVYVASVTAGRSPLTMFPTWAHTGSVVGRGLAAAGDLTGDGLEDGLVGTGMRGDMTSLPDAFGSIAVFDGAGGDVADATVLVTSADSFLNLTQSASTDLDADGVNDLVAWADGRIENNLRTTGGGLVFLGPLATRLTDADRDAQVDPVPSMGSTVDVVPVAVGDTDGDGAAELAFHCWSEPYDVDDGSTSYAGRVWILDGHELETDTRIDFAEAVIETPNGRTGLGWAVTGVDADRDGMSDVAVGAPQSSFFGPGGGATYVFTAPLVGRLDTDAATANWIGDGANLGVGLSLAAGDYTGDASVDLAIGAPGLGTYGGGVFSVSATGL